VTDDVGLSKSVSSSVPVFKVPELNIVRDDLQFTGEVVIDERLNITASWTVNGIEAVGNPISIKIDNRTPTGFLTYTLSYLEWNRSFERNLPELNVTYSYPKGFTETLDLNATYTHGNFNGTPTCTVKLNDSTTLTLKDGSNVLKVTCDSNTDHYTTIDTFTVYVKKIEAVNEDTLDPVDLNTLTTLTAYDNNGHTYDLKTNAKTAIYHIHDQKTSIVLEFIYTADLTNTTLSRVFSNDLMPETTKVCIPNFQPFNEIILYSSTIRPVWVTNATTGCYVAATYTDQLYQDAYATSILVVPKLYAVAVYNENGERVVLGSIYGSKAQAVSLDLLIYKLREVRTTLLPVVYGIEKENENELRIYIKNPAWDNTATEVKIYGPDGQLLFSHYETLQPNDFQIIFNHSTLGLTPDDILRLEIVSYKADGSTRTDTAFFKITGEMGILDPLFGSALAIVIALIALTSVSASAALGPVGLIGVVMALAITAITLRTTMLIFVQVVLAIIFAYIFLVFRAEGKKEVV